jgi:hypothetical protein
MTLRDLQNQGLLLLPTDKEWMLKNASEHLTLARVEMWGLGDGNENGIRLYGENEAGAEFVAEILHFSECLSRGFMSQFLVESYGVQLNSLYSRELKISRVTSSVFALEFIHPFFANKRLSEVIAAES